MIINWYATSLCWLKMWYSTLTQTIILTCSKRECVLHKSGTCILGKVARFLTVYHHVLSYEMADRGETRAVDPLSSYYGPNLTSFKILPYSSLQTWWELVDQLNMGSSKMILISVQHNNILRWVERPTEKGPDIKTSCQGEGQNLPSRHPTSQLICLHKWDTAWNIPSYPG